MKNKCIICKKESFTKLIHFESLPIVLGPVTKNKIGIIPSYPLTMCFCDSCNHVQQINAIPKDISDKIYSDEYYNLTSMVANDIDLFTVNNFYNFFHSCNKVDGEILEIGCFDGNLLLKLYDDGLNIYGIDPSSATKALRNKLGSDRIINDFFTENTFQGKKFDSIIFRNLLEHLHDPNTFIKNVKKILNNQGSIFIDVPNFKAMVDSGGFGEYIHEHISSFTIETLTLLLNNHGFKIEKFEEGDYLYVCAKNTDAVINKSKSKEYIFDNKKLKEKAIENYTKIKDNFLSFFNSSNYKSIGIFGASARTNSLIRILDSNQLDKIKLIVDNDKEKHGKFLDGCNIPILPFKNIKETRLDIVLISTYLFEREILAQLESSDCKKIKAATFHPELTIHQL